MEMLEVTITINLQVRDTHDKLADCLVAIDAAKTLLNDKPGHALLRTKQPRYGAPLVTITKLRRTSQGGIADFDDPPPPLAIDAPIEE